MQQTTEQAARKSTDLLTTEQAADFLGTTPGTLTTWRCTRAVRVPHIRIGRNIRYRRTDLERFLTANTVDTVRP